LLAGQFTALGLLALPDRARRGRRTVGRLAGWGLVAGGGVLAAAGALARGPDLRPLPLPRRGVTLRTSGPYALTRHPIYAGILLAAAGGALATGGRRDAVAPLGLAAVLHTKAGFEERLLGDVVNYAS